MVGRQLPGDSVCRGRNKKARLLDCVVDEYRQEAKAINKMSQEGRNADPSCEVPQEWPRLFYPVRVRTVIGRVGGLAAARGKDGPSGQ